MNDQTTMSDFREQAASLLDKAGDVARDAREQAGKVVGDAREAFGAQAERLTAVAKDAAADAGEKLRAAVAEQQSSGADYVARLADAIRESAGPLGQEIPMASDYLRLAADKVEDVADALRNRDVGELVDNVRDFARAQPTAFLGIAAFIGFAAVRFLKSGAR